MFQNIKENDHPTILQPKEGRSNKMGSISTMVQDNQNYLLNWTLYKKFNYKLLYPYVVAYLNQNEETNLFFIYSI